MNLMKRRLCWPNLVPVYTHSSRTYHDLEHIQSIIRDIPRFTLSEDHRLWMEAVAWLHDAYYDPKLASPGNEYQSACLLDTELGGCFTEKGRFLARETILLTANHVLYQTDLDPLTQMFLDLDLGNLGCPRGQFLLQCQKVSEEKMRSGAPRHAVIEGVQCWAEKMLARERIYYTPEFAVHEDQARENLTHLLLHPIQAADRLPVF